MILNDVRNLFDMRVFPISAADLLFNQYRERDPRIDLPNAVKIRRQNLINYLRSFSRRPSIFIVGEAPGPRGCRFSGVPFSSEVQLSSGELPFMGLKSSISNLRYAEKSSIISLRVILSHQMLSILMSSQSEIVAI